MSLEKASEPEIDSIEQTVIEGDSKKLFEDMIIYEDVNLLILNKKNGVSSQGGQDAGLNLVTLG